LSLAFTSALAVRAAAAFSSAALRCSGVSAGGVAMAERYNGVAR